MSSRFNSRRPVTQPPPVCRRPPPRGPFRFEWPPSQAEMWVDWQGPWPNPLTNHATGTLTLSYRPALNAYIPDINPWYPFFRPFLLHEPLNVTRMWIVAYMEYLLWPFGSAISAKQSQTPGQTIHVTLPPLRRITPGHTFSAELTAIPETLRG